MPGGARVAAWLSLAFSTLLLVSHVARAGHLLLVAHERCAEHGELVHGDDEHGGTSSDTTARVGDAEREEAAPALGAERAPEGHDHCDALAIEHDPQPLAVAVDDVRLLDGYLLPWSLRPGVNDAAVELLLLAPKNSPPT